MFLLKVPHQRRGQDVFTVEEDRLHVNYVETHKTKRVHDLPGFGPIREVEHKGWDKKRLSVMTGRGNEANRYRSGAYRGNGISAPGGWGSICANTAAGLKTVLRRLRPQEEEKLNEIDNRIAELNAEIKRLREERSAVVQEAWGKAHVVRLNEIEPGFKQ